MGAIHTTVDDASAVNKKKTGEIMDKQRARPLAIYWNKRTSKWDVQIRNNGNTTYHGSSKCFGQAFAIRKQTGIPIKKPPGPGRYGEQCKHCGIVSFKDNRVMKGCCRKCNRKDVVRRRLARKAVAGLARCDKCDEMFWLTKHMQPLNERMRRKDWECPQCKLEKRTKKCDECDTVFSRRKRNEEKGREHYKSFCSDKCFRSNVRAKAKPKAKPKRLPVLYWTGTKWSRKDGCEMCAALSRALTVMRTREKQRAIGVTWNSKFHTLAYCNKHRGELSSEAYRNRPRTLQKWKTWKAAFRYWAKIKNHKGEMTWKKKLNSIAGNQRTRMKVKSLRQRLRQS